MFEKSSDMHREIKIFDIEGLMPKEHLLRKIDRVIDFQDIYEMTKNTTVRITANRAAIQ